MFFDIGVSARVLKYRRIKCLGTSLAEFGQAFPSEAVCFEHIFRMRFGENPPCPKCQNTARWYQMSNIRKFQHPCGYGIAPTSKTIFNKSIIPIQLWLYAMLHFTNSRNGVCSNFLHRHLGVSRKTAFRMGTKIRTHMAAIEGHRTIGGKNREVMAKLLSFKRVHTQDRRGTGRANVFVLADKEHIVNIVVGRARRSLLKKVMAERLRPGTFVTTDCQRTYDALADYGFRKPLAQQAPGSWRKFSHTPGPIRGFWSNASRATRRTYRHISRKHLWTYIKEFEFRYNRRLQPQDSFWNIVSDFPSMATDDVEALRGLSDKTTPYLAKQPE